MLETISQDDNGVDNQLVNTYSSPSLSVMATAPGAGVSGDEVWSDRKAVEEGGKITAINIKKSGSGNFIGAIRTR